MVGSLDILALMDGIPLSHSSLGLFLSTFQISSALSPLPRASVVKVGILLLYCYLPLPIVLLKALVTNQNLIICLCNFVFLIRSWKKIGSMMVESIVFH